MSGGSFNYLCHRDASTVFGDDLHKMAEELEALGFLAKGAAARTRALAELQAHIDSEIAALSEVWRAVEWWQSNDYGRDQVYVELGAFRERQKAARKRP